MGTRANQKSYTAPIEFADDRPLWHRQPGETDLLWARFETYLKWPDVERPSAEVLAAHLSTPRKKVAKATIHKQIVKWRWGERVEAFDNEAQSEVMPVVIEHTTRMTYDFLEAKSRHLSTLEAFIGSELGKMLKESQDSPIPIVGASTIIQMMKFWVSVHAMVPAPVDAAETDGEDPDLEELSAGDLRTMHEILKKRISS